MSMQSDLLTKEVHKAAQSGLEAVETILPKVTKPSLKKEIENQGVAYQKLIARSEKILQQSGSLPEKNPPIQKAVMWGAIQLNTLADASPEHVAEMMINGSNMGIVEMSKQVNRYEFADHKSLKLAADFIEGEQRHIEQMKEYL